MPEERHAGRMGCSIVVMGVALHDGRAGVLECLLEELLRYLEGCCLEGVRRRVEDSTIGPQGPRHAASLRSWVVECLLEMLFCNGTSWLVAKLRR